MIIGATGALFTGLIGIVQNDIKRVVAYSTLSQLGYMTVALGVSAYSAAVFHLMTHAFFKALLFLGAGSVIIAMHHEQDMRKMGGLRKYMPITFITMWIGTLALVGTPFFSGFYSKDTIIEAAQHHAHVSSSWVATYGYWAVLGGVIVTSFYSFRLLFLTFHGKERFRDAHDDHGHGHDDHHAADAHADAHHGDAHHGDTHHDDHGHGHGPHEPHETPWVVTLPLILLAIPSIFIGFFSIGPMLYGTDWAGHHAEHGIPGQVHSFFTGVVDFYDPARNTIGALAEEFHGPIGFVGHAMKGPAVWLTLAGFLLAVLFYLWKPELATRARKTFAPLVSVLENKYGFDKLWIGGFAGGGIKLGKVSRAIDTNIVDGVVVNGSARLIDLAANLLRRTQSGFLYHYAFAMIIGLIALLGVLMHYLR
jgi:NADH-quinone oxidoreductase subunit L